MFNLSRDSIILRYSDSEITEGLLSSNLFTNSSGIVLVIIDKFLMSEVTLLILIFLSDSKCATNSSVKGEFISSIKLLSDKT